MRNIGLYKYLDADVDSFTSDFGMKMRAKTYPVIKNGIKVLGGVKIIVDHYPSLIKNQPYIYISTHAFVDEVVALLATIDRAVYTLSGTTDQLKHNPLVYANWLRGLIYVDRMNPASRSAAIPKMERVIDNGISVLLFPEGGLNNTENLLLQKIFAGAYYLQKKTEIQIVPVSTYKKDNSKTVYLNFGEPINVSQYDKNEALEILRDALATCLWSQIEQHSPRLKRAELSGDIRINFLQERKKEYLQTKWSHDVWDEELTVYKDRQNPLPVDIRKFIDNIHFTKQNLPILYPILFKRMEDKRYDFLDYMHKNWNKDI